jgi:Flp pilus assembly protein TadB
MAVVPVAVPMVVALVPAIAMPVRVAMPVVAVATMMTAPVVIAAMLCLGASGGCCQPGRRHNSRSQSRGSGKIPEVLDHIHPGSPVVLRMIY